MSSLVRACTHHGCGSCHYAPVTETSHRRPNHAVAHGWWESHLPGLSGPLKALCWCERRVVTVERTDLIRGVTDVCGADDCRAPS